MRCIEPSLFVFFFFLKLFGQGSVFGMQCTLGHSLLGIQFTVVIFTYVFKLSFRHIPAILLWS